MFTKSNDAHGREFELCTFAEKLCTVLLLQNILQKSQLNNAYSELLQTNCYSEHGTAGFELTTLHVHRLSRQSLTVSAILPHERLNFREFIKFSFSLIDRL